MAKSEDRFLVRASQDVTIDGEIWGLEQHVSGGGVKTYGIAGFDGKAEKERQANEAERATAEANRKGSEAARESSEAKRVDAEKDRVAEDAKRTARLNEVTARADASASAAGEAASKANAILAQLPLPDGNVPRGHAKGELATVDDSFGAPPLSINILGNTKQNLWVYHLGTADGITASEADDGSLRLEGTAAKAAFLVSRWSTIKPSTSYYFAVDRIDNGLDFYIENAADTGPIYLSNSMKSRVFKTQATTHANPKVSISIKQGTTLNGNYRVMLREATPEEIAQAEQKPKTVQGGGMAGIQRDRPTPLPADPEACSESQPFDWIRPGIHGAEPTVLNVSGRNLIYDSTLHNADNSGNNIDGNGWISGVGNSLWWNYVNADLVVNLPAGKLKLLVEVSTSASTPALFGFIVETEDGARLLDVTGRDYTIGSRTYDFTLTHSANVGIMFKPFGARARFAIYPKGDGSEAYSPSAGSSTAIDLRGNHLHSLSDVNTDRLRIDSSGKVTLRRKVLSIDGVQASNAVSGVTPQNGQNKAFAFLAVPKPYPKANACEQLDCISDKYTNDGALKARNAYRSWNGLIVVDDRFASVEEAKRILREENPTFFYSIPETAVELGSIALPGLPPGVAHVWTDADVAPEIDAEYIRDINIVLARLEGAVPALASAML